jgi:uncharacterized protein (DUF488 family)
MNKNTEVKSELIEALKKPEASMSELEREQYLKMERVVRYVSHKKDELKKAEALFKELAHG